MDIKSADGDAQEVDVQDVDLSTEPIAPRGTAPPPLPAVLTGPSAVGAVPPSQPPAAPAAPLAPLAAQAPTKQRGPLFFIGLLVAVLAVGLAAGAGVMLTRSKPPPPPAAAAQAAPKSAPVITIPVVDMADEPETKDGGR